MKIVRIGAGAGYAADRWEPARDLIARGDLDYIVFECLAERTIALGQLERLRDPERGYNPFLEDRWRACLALAREKGVTIVTNMGAANPHAAGLKTRALAKELAAGDCRVATITGDDVTDLVRANPDLLMMETGEPVDSLGNSVISANAYLGAEAVRDALAAGANVVITGRVADPSLFLGCLMHAHGWRWDDWPRIAAGTVVGHLLECAGQVTGGYFADPGVKDVPDLANLGFPLAEVAADGAAFVTKAPGTGGVVTVATCKEQLLYECGDPFAYVTPDCVADFSGVGFSQEAESRVSVTGAAARPRTDSLKTSVCYRAGYIGEAQVGYAGPNARARAELAAEIVRERLKRRTLDIEELRIDLIGIDSLHGQGSLSHDEPYETRLRVAGRTDNRRHAEYLGQEVQSLLTNGPYGGGGDFMQVRDIVGVRSVLLPRSLVQPQIEML